MQDASTGNFNAAKRSAWKEEDGGQKTERLFGLNLYEPTGITLRHGLEGHGMIDLAIGWKFHSVRYAHFAELPEKDKYSIEEKIQGRKMVAFAEARASEGWPPEV